ncbi:uncharacterized protein [Macrobrachium rosenbergii]|uniref:uncharacterized protein n=1 Tax=Macrobrachium rosenbergii TaxID=79674 RepID=UPI0034D75485
MFKWHLVAVALCLTLAPSFAQITFSRSWVPQGKRSSSSPPASAAAAPQALPGSPGASSGSDLLVVDACLEARLAALSQVAEHLADLLEETADEDSSHSYRLKQALVARRRKMS